MNDTGWRFGQGVLVIFERLHAESILIDPEGGNGTNLGCCT